MQDFRYYPLGRLSFVMVMQTAHFWPLSDCPQLWWLHRSRLRRIHLQRSVCPPIVIVIHIGSKDAAQMPFVEHNHVVQTLTTDRPCDRVAAI
jgi:hypothetical protein